MKVLFDHSEPFLLAHGGFQIQIEQTKLALEKLRVQVDHLRWWDESQRADIIHYFGRPPEHYINMAHGKNIRVVLGDLLTELGSRSWQLRCFQKALTRVAQRALPPAFTARLAWNSFRLADACMALTPWEGQLMTQMFGASPNRVHVIPNGVEEAFLQSVPRPRGPWLVCTATITDRKRVVELAEAAVRAKTPLWVLGKPYNEKDRYARRFFSVVNENPSVMRYEGAISDRARLAVIYREARGFALLSTKESLSLSALEAAACGCPLLLSDLPWARCTFGTAASYCPITDPAGTARVLREFYERAPELPAAPRPKSWLEVATMLKSLYEQLLKNSV